VNNISSVSTNFAVPKQSVLTQVVPILFLQSVRHTNNIDTPAFPQNEHTTMHEKTKNEISIRRRLRCRSTRCRRSRSTTASSCARISASRFRILIRIVDAFRFVFCVDVVRCIRSLVRLTATYSRPNRPGLRCSIGSRSRDRRRPLARCSASATPAPPTNEH
jgi:hypothetical protein